GPGRIPYARHDLLLGGGGDEPAGRSADAQRGVRGERVGVRGCANVRHTTHHRLRNSRPRRGRLPRRIAMTRWHGNREFWAFALRAEAPAFRQAAGQPGALDATVPSCPGWTVADLVRHLGAVYRWVRSHASRGVTSRPEQPRPVADDDVPTGPAALTWWDGEYAALSTVLDKLDPEMPAWNWAPQPKKVGFWHRRMAHETAVHRWDAQMATGLAEP